MKIRMLQSTKGSPDGIEVRQYEAGTKYDVPEELAAVFLSQGWAEEDKEFVLETKAETQGEGQTRKQKRRR
jgi:hypothetical protein